MKEDKKSWSLTLMTFNEVVVKSVILENLTEEEAEKEGAKICIGTPLADLYSIDEIKHHSEKSERWIRPKIIAIFEPEHKLVGIYKVNSNEEIEAIKTLIVKFPMYYEIYDDIIDFSEAVSIKESYDSIDIKLTFNGKTMEISRNKNERTMKKLKDYLEKF
jgi:geranylgeranyl pyrophosphate synthase